MEEVLPPLTESVDLTIGFILRLFSGLTLVFGNLGYCLRLLVEKDPKLYVNNWL